MWVWIIDDWLFASESMFVFEWRASLWKVCWSLIGFVWFSFDPSEALRWTSRKRKREERLLMSFGGRMFFVGSLMVTTSTVLLVNYYLHREKQLLFLNLKFLLTKQKNLEETRQSFEGSFSSVTRTRTSNSIENEWELMKNSLSNANKSFIFWKTNSISGKFWKKLNKEVVLLQWTSPKVTIGGFDLDLCSF